MKTFAKNRSNTAVIIFAKAPVAGFVKTRLNPVLSSDRSAQLHKLLVCHVLSQSQGVADADPYLYCAPSCEHPFFASLRERFSIVLRKQMGIDLGARMRQAFTEILSSHSQGILVGTDLPELSSEILIEAQNSLAGEADVVFVPTEDGGYGLIGLKQVHHFLFEHIPWGSRSVMAVTLQRASMHALTVKQLAPMRDLDTPEDYYYYQSHISRLEKKYKV